MPISSLLRLNTDRLLQGSLWREISQQRATLGMISPHKIHKLGRSHELQESEKAVYSIFKFQLIYFLWRVVWGSTQGLLQSPYSEITPVSEWDLCDPMQSWLLNWLGLAVCKYFKPCAVSLVLKSLCLLQSGGSCVAPSFCSPELVILHNCALHGPHVHESNVETFYLATGQLYLAKLLFHFFAYAYCSLHHLNDHCIRGISWGLVFNLFLWPAATLDHRLGVCEGQRIFLIWDMHRWEDWDYQWICLCKAEQFLLGSVDFTQVYYLHFPNKYCLVFASSTAPNVLWKKKSSFLCLCVCVGRPHQWYSGITSGWYFQWILRGKTVPGIQPRALHAKQVLILWIISLVLKSSF